MQTIWVNPWTFTVLVITTVIHDGVLFYIDLHVEVNLLTKDSHVSNIQFKADFVLNAWKQNGSTHRRFSGSFMLETSFPIQDILNLLPC